MKKEYNIDIKLIEQLLVQDKLSDNQLKYLERMCEPDIDETFLDVQSVIKFMESNPKIDHEIYAQVYLNYKYFCSQNNLQFATKVMFSKVLYGIYKYTSKVYSVRGLSTRKIVKL